MATAIQALQEYAESFRAIENSAASRSLPWLRTLQQEAFARFNNAGFPTTRDEDWRFTNLAPVAQTRYTLGGSSRAAVTRKQLEPFTLEGAACQLVFVDGRFSAELSSRGELPEGVTVTNLAAQLAENPGAIEPHLGKYLDTKRDSLAALNTAFIEDGAYVHVQKSAVVEPPIHLLFVSAAHETATISHPRNLIVAEENSQATIVEDYVSLHGGVALSNTVTELVAGDAAVIAHYILEREHTQAFNISTLRIQQGRGANVASHSVLLGGSIVRNNVHPVLAGEGSDCLINGLFIGAGKQHLDNYMLVEHASPRCASRQFYNGILDGKAHGVFHGRIVVHKDAQKTDAKQTNRNLLLSDTAQIDTKPQLEIYADDVKCTHGATIGQIEESALFYLRSRGIDELSARRLLLMAFAKECLDRMNEGPTRVYVEAMIQDHLLTIEKSSAAFSQPAQEHGVLAK